MPSESKAAAIRGLISFGMIVGAVALALWFGVPGCRFGGWGAEEGDEGQVTAENYEEIRNQKGCVVVIHSHQPGNEDSEKTREILAELDEEQRYGELVKMAELDIEEYPEVAKMEGVSEETAPQLGFYVNGTRVGEYRGPWSKEPVQRKIDEVLRGYMQRIGKDWRPPVHGMERDRGDAPPIIDIRPSES